MLEWTSLETGCFISVIRVWFSPIKMIFDFFKRLFGLVDETSRKRRASIVDDDYSTNISNPKKLCCERERIRVNKIIYADENDDEEEIEILKESHCQPVRLTKRTNGTAVTCARRRSYAYACRKNLILGMNGRDNTRHGCFYTKNATSKMNSNFVSSTLAKTNQLREKQEYGQLLQCFLPQKDHETYVKARNDATKRQAVVTEVIDLENYESPAATAKSKNTTWSYKKKPLATFSTSATSTPLNRLAKNEAKNRVAFRKAVTPNEKISEPSSSAISPTKRIENAEGATIASPTRETPTDNSGSASPLNFLAKNNVEAIWTNTLRDNFAAKPVIRPDYVPRISDRYNERIERSKKEQEELERATQLLSKHNRLMREATLEERLASSMHLYEAVLDDTEDLKEAALPELTQSMIQEIKRALIPDPPNEVLVESFGLRITRKDIRTLSDLNWLNDEVINFYMNLLIVRGASGDKYPKVHATNTFFYPKLLSGGHTSLKRWTRKIDIFAQDILVVPIHLGIHWCMSIVDFRDKTIRYYDSMGGSNPKCLQALRHYLEEESMDKKKKPFDTNDWKLESMKDIPQQMNGSDCGVFSCMFAEFITGNRKITFTQQDMPYFRNKMVYEILKAKLLETN